MSAAIVRWAERVDAGSSPPPLESRLSDRALLRLLGIRRHSIGQIIDHDARYFRSLVEDSIRSIRMGTDGLEPAAQAIFLGWCEELIALHFAQSRAVLGLARDQLARLERESARRSVRRK